MVIAGSEKAHYSYDQSFKAYKNKPQRERNFKEAGES